MNEEKLSNKLGRVTLKDLANRLGLTAGTISAVLNNTRAAARIPLHTRDRVIAAARELNYQPNPLARALRTGVASTPLTISPDLNSARGAILVLGAHQFDLAISAMQNAGLRVHDDFSVLDLADVPAAWDFPAFKFVPNYPASESDSKAP